MASTNTIAAATLVIILGAAALVSGVAASSCDDEISGLTPCYSYLEGSGSKRPASDCCSSLGKTAATKPQCLCQILSADNNLNKTRIAELPKSCNITTPPATACNSTKFKSAGYSTKISNSIQLSLIAASYASILMINLFF